MIRIKYYLKESNRPPLCFVVAHVFIKTGNPRIYLFTELTIDRDQWDSKTQRVRIKGKDKAESAAAMNNYLDSFRTSITNKHFDFLASNPTAEFQEMKENLQRQFRRKCKTELDFMGYYDEYLTTQKNKIALSTHKTREAVKKILCRFTAKTKYKLTFETINPIFHDKFTLFMAEEGIKNTSAGQTIQLVKGFMNWALSNELHNNLKFKKFSVKNTHKDIIFLEQEELQKIKDLDLTGNKLYSDVRDLFLFGCQTGQRYSDISNIKWEDIKGDVWHLTTKKTKEIIKINLGSEAYNLLMKHSGEKTPLPRIKIQNVVNLIKKICKLAQIDSKVTTISFVGSQRIEETKFKYELIGTHTARRTFVTFSLMQGMKPETIMKITGHSDYKMLAKYLKITDKEAAKEMKRIYGDSNLKLVNDN